MKRMIKWLCCHYNSLYVTILQDNEGHSRLLIIESYALGETQNIQTKHEQSANKQISSGMKHK